MHDTADDADDTTETAADEARPVDPVKLTTALAVTEKDVPSLATVTLSVEAPQNFILRKIQIDRAEAKYFDMIDLLIGNRAVIDSRVSTSRGGLALEDYCDCGLDIVVPQGMAVALTVRNASDEPRSLTMLLV